MIVGLLIAVFAGTAAEIAVLIPPVLLLTMAGLALLQPLTIALRDLTAGPLLLGPLFAFAIALSDMTLFGLGSFFWSLVIGHGRLGRVRTGGVAAAPRGEGGGMTDPVLPSQR